MNSFVTYQLSPVGLLRISGSKSGIASLAFVDEKKETFNDDHPLAIQCRVELKEYLAKERTEFTLPLAPQGTMFQQIVWKELMTIPFGARRTYADIAIAVGSAQMIRAVGNANARNPIAIVIPCHRVVGSDASLTGYAGGLWRKQWLLDHEASEQSPQLF